jgi:hypothetical protein
MPKADNISFVLSDFILYSPFDRSPVPHTYNCQRLHVVSQWRTFASTGAHHPAAGATISVDVAAWRGVKPIAKVSRAK